MRFHQPCHLHPERDRKRVIASMVYTHMYSHFSMCYSMIYQQIIIISTENKSYHISFCLENDSTNKVSKITISTISTMCSTIPFL